MVSWFIFQCLGFLTENGNNILTNLIGVGNIKWINAYKLLRTVSRIQVILAVSLLLLIIHAEAEFYFFFQVIFLESVDRAGLSTWEKKAFF